MSTASSSSTTVSSTDDCDNNRSRLTDDQNNSTDFFPSSNIRVSQYICILKLKIIFYEISDFLNSIIKYLYESNDHLQNIVIFHHPSKSIKFPLLRCYCFVACRKPFPLVNFEHFFGSSVHLIHKPSDCFTTPGLYICGIYHLAKSFIHVGGCKCQANHILSPQSHYRVIGGSPAATWIFDIRDMFTSVENKKL